MGESISFSFELESNIFVPVTKYDKTRKRIIISRGWTEKVDHLIWLKEKMPCVWSFKHATYRLADVRATGHCAIPICKATVIAVSNLRLKTISFNITGYDKSVPHNPSRKRKVGDATKRKLSEMLDAKPAYVVRSKLGDTLMDVNDPEPAQLPTANALRIIKHRKNTESVKNQHYALSLLQLRKKYVDCIHDIGLDSFFVFYASVLQRAWYRAETFRQRSVISIDATGLGLRVPESNKYIFLYMICCRGRDKSIPVAQMLSQNHTASFIYFWLNNWLKTNKKPHEIIIDDSKALLSACVQAFTQFKTTNEYLSACMESILYGSDPPQSYVQILPKSKIQ